MQIIWSYEGKTLKITYTHTKTVRTSSTKCVHTKPLQSCPTLCNPIDCSPPGSSAMEFFRQYWSGLPFPPPKLINRLYFKTFYQYQNILFHFLEHTIELLTCLSKTISVQMCNFYPTIKDQKISFPFSLNNMTFNIYHPPSLLLLLLVLSGFLNSCPLFWAISPILMYTLSPFFLFLVVGRLKESKRRKILASCTWFHSSIYSWYRNCSVYHWTKRFKEALQWLTFSDFQTLQILCCLIFQVCSVRYDNHKWC